MRQSMGTGENRGKEFEGTTVDLGEDLLEATKALERPPQPVVAQNDVVENDEFQRAEILMAERLYDDAKKIFRKILRTDPGHTLAREKLEEIQKVELQELLGSDSGRKRLGASDEIEQDTPTTVIEKLERDLRINIDRAEAKPVPDLFKDEIELSKYTETVLASISAQDHRSQFDVGIAYLEMGLFSIAQAVFEHILRHEAYRIEGMYLLGLALIYGGKAIEATIRLEPMARDLTLTGSQKADFLYLMGLAFETLHDARKAREFYRRVFLLNPRYRDIVEKLK